VRGVGWPEVLRLGVVVALALMAATPFAAHAQQPPPQPPPTEVPTVNSVPPREPAASPAPPALAPAPARPSALPPATEVPTVRNTPPGATPEGTVITQVDVEGTQRIDPDTVRSYVLLKPGEAATPASLDKSLKALFATGLFADVTLRMQGDHLAVRVVENPIINRIAFEGNRKLTDKVLTDEVQLKPRVVYTRTKVQNDVKRVLELYRRSGRFAATVEPKVVQLPQNRVDLIFEINEGSVTGVERIAFVGNQHFSDDTLRGTIRTVESRWWRIFSTDDNYDPDRVSFDRELLRKFYLGKGYADFRVVSAVAELTPDRTGFYITFTVDEGERYKFGDINVVSHIKNLNGDDLKGALTTVKDDWYDADAVETSINAVTTAVGTKGYAFVEVRPRINRNREAKTVSVTYDVQEGPKVYVERININGNVRTLDKVIRREFQLVEGDAFNTAKMRRSRQRIQNLGFFDKVDVTNVPGSSADKTVINVDVRERSTGEISFGVGFSTADGALGDIGLEERNLLGTGKNLRLGFLLAQRRQQIDLSYTDPYFLDRKIAAGFDLFDWTRNLQLISGYDEESFGGALRAGYQITDTVRQNVRYTIREDKLTDFVTTVSPYVLENAGATLTSMVSQDLTYDRRDDRFDPRSGYFVRLSTDLAGVGGDQYFARNRLQMGTYYSVIEDYVVSVTGDLGYLEPLSNDLVHISNRFFLGGDSLRGFQTGGVGPRDVLTGSSLGGKEMYAGSLEFTFPTGLPKEIGIRGAAFTDFGALSKSGEDQSIGGPIQDSMAVRVSAGVGALWRSPFGPVKVSVARPIIKEDFDRTELFRFSFGSKF
jgi:outer membrane protein insertion porin family